MEGSMKNFLLLLAGCALFGCALTPGGLDWGADVASNEKEIRDQINEVAKEGGWANLSAEAMRKISEDVVAKRVAGGMTEEQARAEPIGWREVLEVVAGGSCLTWFLRERKYNLIRTLKGPSNAKEA
jgi:hypothetical protein